VKHELPCCSTLPSSRRGGGASKGRTTVPQKSGKPQTVNEKEMGTNTMTSQQTQRSVWQERASSLGGGQSKKTDGSPSHFSPRVIPRNKKNVVDEGQGTEDNKREKKKKRFPPIIPLQKKGELTAGRIIAIRGFMGTEGGRQKGLTRKKKRAAT